MISAKFSIGVNEGISVLSSFELNRSSVKYNKEKFTSDLVFIELYQNGLFKDIDLRSILLSYFNEGINLKPIEKLFLYYVFKTLDFAAIRSQIIKSISNSLSDISKRADSLISKMEDNLNTLLGADIDYGLNIGEELYSSLPKYSFPKIFDEEGYVKPEFRKPIFDSKFNIDNYYKEGRNGDLYYPYAFRSGPNNPDVNHNLIIGDENVKESFNVLRDFINILSNIDVNKVTDLIMTKLSMNLNNSKETELSKMIRFILSNYNNEKVLCCDSRFLSGLNIFPTLVYSNNFGVATIMGSFISNTLGVKVKKKDNSFNISGMNLEDINLDGACIVFNDSSTYQYNVFKRHLCTPSFDDLYDKISDYVYEKYLSNFDKYSTIHNIVTANVFTLIMCGNSNSFGDYSYVSMPIINAKYEYILDDIGSVVLTKIDLSLGDEVSYSGEIQKKITISEKSPIVFIFNDSNGFMCDINDKVLGITNYKGADLSNNSIFNPIDIVG